MPSADAGAPGRTISFDEELIGREARGVVEGAVYDLGGRPLPEVFLGMRPEGGGSAGPLLMTDSAGRFRFSDVPAGRHWVELRAPGFLAQAHEVQVLSDRTESLCVILRADAMAPPEIDSPPSHG